MMQNTPKSDGFRFPAEFEPHHQTWLMWPDRADIYPNNAADVQKSYVDLTSAILRFEPVTMCVSRDEYLAAKSLLPETVRLIEMSYNGNWLRDTGPSFLLDNKGNLRGVDWMFNAWGGLNSGCYFPWDQDDLVASKILSLERATAYKPHLVLEGGSFSSDGEGTLLVTEESLICPDRNPGKSKSEIESILRDHLNIEKIIWFKRGNYLDEAGGHVDGLCMFVRPGSVVLNWTEDESDPQYEISREALDVLRNVTDAKGRRLKVQKIHQPGPLYITGEESESIKKVSGTVPRNEGDRLPGTYINFYFVNGGIIVPLFGDQHDQNALDVFKDLFPDRDIIPFESRSILLGGGNIHCMTQQQPKILRNQQ